jgi:hypothetical protein
MTVITTRHMFTHTMLIWRDAFLPQCSTIWRRPDGHLNQVPERGPFWPTELKTRA